MKGLVHIVFFVFALLLILSCRPKTGLPRNKYLEMKEKPSQKLAKENKRAQKKVIKDYKTILKLNKRDAYK